MSGFQPATFPNKLSPKNVNAMERQSFQNKMKGMNRMNINDLLKSKASALPKNKPASLQPPRPQLMQTIKKKHMDDEKDSSYCSSNETKKISSKQSSSSSEEDSSDNDTSANKEAKTAASSSAQSKLEQGNDKDTKIKSVYKLNESGRHSSTEGSTSDDDSNLDNSNKRKKKLTTFSSKNIKTSFSTKKNVTSGLKAESSSSSDESSSEDDVKQKEVAQSKNTEVESSTTASSENDSETGSDFLSHTEMKTAKEVTNTYAEMFDDDSDSDSDSDLQAKTLLNTTNYIATDHTQQIQSDYVEMCNLAAVSLQGSFNINEITEDDEVFFMQIEKKIDPKSLLKKKFTFERNQKLVLNTSIKGNESHHCLVEFDKGDREKLCMLTNNSGTFDIKHLHTSGSFTLNERRHVEDEKPKTVEFKAKEKCPFPEDKLRERHPLFGRPFEKMIVLDEQSTKELEDLINEKLSGIISGCKSETVTVSVDNSPGKRQNNKEQKVGLSPKGEKSTNVQNKMSKKNKLDVDAVQKTPKHDKSLIPAIIKSKKQENLQISNKSKDNSLKSKETPEESQDSVDKAVKKMSKKNKEVKNAERKSDVDLASLLSSFAERNIEKDTKKSKKNEIDGIQKTPKRNQSPKTKPEKQENLQTNNESRENVLKLQETSKQSQDTVDNAVKKMSKKKKEVKNVEKKSDLDLTSIFSSMDEKKTEKETKKSKKKDISTDAIQKTPKRDQSSTNLSKVRFTSPIEQELSNKKTDELKIGAMKPPVNKKLIFEPNDSVISSFNNKIDDDLMAIIDNSLSLLLNKQNSPKKSEKKRKRRLSETITETPTPIVEKEVKAKIKKRRPTMF